MRLSDTAIRAAKSTERPQKLFDGDGLYLLLNPSGTRWWRFKYRFGGKEKLLSLGTYPEVSLKQARARRDEARRQIADYIDPADKRKAEKLAAADTFEAIAREWLPLQKKKLKASTFEKAQWTLETLIFPHLSSKPISKLTAADFLVPLRKVEGRGKHETAHRAKQRCGQVMRYAVATSRAERDVTADLRGALAPVVTRNRPSITDPVRIGQLLRAIESYEGYPATSFALRLSPHVFTRPTELRAAEWSEFDLDAAEWRIPPERMKMGEGHIVPLSEQAVGLLRELHAYTGRGKYLFPSVRSSLRPMSDNTVNAALRRLGYTKDEMCGHGFRALASTTLNELGWAPDVIELQLAHKEPNKVRASYNRATRLAERRKMMQAWSNHLDKLRQGAAVPGQQKAA